jgi:hypothetical protein
MQIPNHPSRNLRQTEKIKKIKLNQNFKPALRRQQKQKTSATLVAKKTHLIKTFEYVGFSTQHHKRY